MILAQKIVVLAGDADAAHTAMRAHIVVVRSAVDDVLGPVPEDGSTP